MVYVDHAFSFTDEDIMMETSYTVKNRPPVKKSVLAIALLVFGTLGIFMAYNRVGGYRAHGLGVILFIPGFCYTRIALQFGIDVIIIECLDHGSLKQENDNL